MNFQASKSCRRRTAPRSLASEQFLRRRAAITSDPALANLMLSNEQYVNSGLAGAFYFTPLLRARGIFNILVQLMSDLSR